MVSQNIYSPSYASHQFRYFTPANLQISALQFILNHYLIILLMLRYSLSTPAQNHSSAQSHSPQSNPDLSNLSQLKNSSNGKLKFVEISKPAQKTCFSDNFLYFIKNYRKQIRRSLPKPVKKIDNSFLSLILVAFGSESLENFSLIKKQRIVVEFKKHIKNQVTINTFTSQLKFGYIIVCHRRNHLSNEGFLYEISLLDTESTIRFNITNIHSWKYLLKLIMNIQRKLSKSKLLIFRKSIIQKVQSTYFSSQIDQLPSQDLEEFAKFSFSHDKNQKNISIFESSQQNDNLKLKQNLQNLSILSLRKFLFIMEALEKNLTRLAQKLNCQQIIKIKSLTYNLSSEIITNLQQPFLTQISEKSTEIENCLGKFIKERLKIEDQSNDDHYPYKLINAQHCWQCRERVTIYCPTCSEKEKRTVPLSLECYKVHHSQKVSFQKQELNQLYQKWTIQKEKWEIEQRSQRLIVSQALALMQNTMANQPIIKLEEFNQNIIYDNHQPES